MHSARGTGSNPRAARADSRKRGFTLFIKHAKGNFKLSKECLAVFTPFAVHYQKICYHLTPTSNSNAKINSFYSIDIH